MDAAITPAGISTSGIVLPASSSSSQASASSVQQQQEEEASSTTRPVIVLTPAQATAEASSKNPFHGYNNNIHKNKNVATTAHEDGGGDGSGEIKNNEKNNNKKSIFEFYFDKCIDVVAYVVARILNHPDVRDAVSSAILEGLIKVCYVENLHDHVKQVDATLSKHQVLDAAKKGKDTQKIVKAYLGGIFSDNSNDSDNKKKKDE